MSIQQASVKSRPILFHPLMIEAILAGRKTQTRRLIRGRLPVDAPELFDCGRQRSGRYGFRYGEQGDHPSPCGGPGDLLWVREKFKYVLSHYGFSFKDDWWKASAQYADSTQGLRYGRIKAGTPSRWRPSIHMPQWASRITLEITRVRAERLKLISLDDIEAEGFPRCTGTFASFWNKLYNHTEFEWMHNPHVWVYEFKRVEAQA